MGEKRRDNLRSNQELREEERGSGGGRGGKVGGEERVNGGSGQVWFGGLPLRFVFACVLPLCLDAWINKQRLKFGGFILRNINMEVVCVFLKFTIIN